MDNRRYYIKQFYPAATNLLFIILDALYGSFEKANLFDLGCGA